MLKVSISTAKKKKSVVTLKQDTTKFLNDNVFPFLADEIAFETFADFLEDQIRKGKKFFMEEYYEEEREYYKRMNK